MTLDPGRRRPARLIVAAAAVLTGVLLLVLATPRLFAAIEEALYDEESDHGKHAREAFAAHMEGEKSDAA